jgi:hypothetical protein
MQGFGSAFPDQSLQQFGYQGREKEEKDEECCITDAAERASIWLWLKRGEPWSHGS